MADEQQATVQTNPQDQQQTQITNPPSEGENPTEKRIKALSGKVEQTAKERDEAIARAEAAAKKAVFAESFIDIVSANPAAKDHKADIEAKVMAGYTPQDAAYAVLGPLGKLGAQAPQPTMAPITGGSAPTLINNQGMKAANEMNRDELRQQLIDAQRKGDLFLS